MQADRVLQLQNLAARIDSDLGGQIALSDRGGYLSNIADLRSQIAAHEVHTVREILPHAADAFNIGLSSQLFLRAFSEPRA